MSCGGGNKVLKEAVNKNKGKKYSLNKHYSKLKPFLEELMGNYKSENNRYEEKYLLQKKAFPFNDPDDYNWQIKIDEASKETISIDDVVCSDISIDGEFIVAIKREHSREKKKKKISYSYVIYHINSNSEKNISSESFVIKPDKKSKKYSLIKWSPLGKVFAFIDYSNEISNVNLCFVNYINNEIVYTIFKVTENKNESTKFYDLQWSSACNYLSYTVENDDQRSSIEIYDLAKNRYIKLTDAQNIRNLRFEKKKNKFASFIKEESYGYGVFLGENVDDNKFVKKANKIANYKSPLIFSSFATHTEKFVSINYDNENYNFSFYNYKKEKVITLKETDQKVNLNSSSELLIVKDPLWLYNDNIVIFCDNSKLFNINLLEDYKVISPKSERSINALSKDRLDNFYYSFFRNGYKIQKLKINLTNNIKAIDVEEKYFKAKIVAYNPETNIATIKRNSRPIPSSKFNINDLQGDVYKKLGNKSYDAELNLKKDNITFKKDRFLILRWPDTLKKKITVSVKNVDESIEINTEIDNN